MTQNKFSNKIWNALQACATKSATKVVKNSNIKNQYENQQCLISEVERMKRGGH